MTQGRGSAHNPMWTVPPRFAAARRYRVRLELLPGREVIERTVLTTWGELKAAVIATLDVVREDRGRQIYSVDVERLDGARRSGEVDLVDGYGEKR